MKFAYLIIAHNEPLLFEILLRLLDDERNDIYVHIDKKTDISQFDKFKLKYSNLIFINRIPVYWGDESQIQVELNLLQAAHSHGGYDYYHLLSGVDLPLKSQNFIHRFFEEHAGTEFVGITHSDFNLNDLKHKTAYYYFFTKYYRSIGWKAWFLRKISNLLIMLQSTFKVERRYDVSLSKGPNWFSISDLLCQYILNRKEIILDRFKYVLCPDEMFLQTEIMNSYFQNNIYDSEDQFEACMREIDWKRGNPYVWRNNDVNELKKSNRLFARKFSTKYMSVVNEIIDYISSCNK